MDAYLSDSDCVIAVGGGEIMCDILPYIDFKKLKKVLNYLGLFSLLIELEESPKSLELF